MTWWYFFVFLCGLYISGIAYGAISPWSDSEARDQWMRNYGRWMKLVGPFVAIYSMAMVVASYLGLPVP